jgi:hypothetical protein
MWSFYDKDGKPLPPRKLLLLDGREVDQAWVAEQLANMLEEAIKDGFSLINFYSAAGTGKTLMALAALLELVINQLLEGKTIIILEPLKSTESAIEEMLMKIKVINEAGELIPKAFYGMDEFPCPYLQEIKGRSAAKARDCVRNECPLYLPPKPKPEDPNVTTIKLVAKWSNFLYGATDISPKLASKAVEIKGAYLCPYFAQYAFLDKDGKPKVLIMNYAKFVMDLYLGRISLDDIAGIIIDEFDEFLRRFARPSQIEVAYLEQLRRELRKMEGSSDISGIIKKLLGYLDDIIERVRRLDDNGTDPTLAGYLVGLLRTAMKYSTELGAIAEDILEILNMDPFMDSTHVSITYRKNSDALLVIPFRVPILEMITKVPTIAITATPDYFALKRLGLEHVNARTFMGQLTPPGKIILVPFPGAKKLDGWHISQKVVKRTQYAEICREALKLALDTAKEVGAQKVVGYSIGKVYLQVCGGYPNIFIDDATKSISYLESAMKNPSMPAVLSTRTFRGVNITFNPVVSFILKYPRISLDSPEIQEFDMWRKRGEVVIGFFQQYMDGKGRGNLESVTDFMNEMANVNLYQALTRGNRGDDYVNYVVCVDLTACAVIGMMSEARLLPKLYVYIEGSVIEVTEDELKKMRAIYYERDYYAEKEWAELIERWRARVTGEGKAAVVREEVQQAQQVVQERQEASARPVSPHPSDPNHQSSPVGLAPPSSGHQQSEPTGQGLGPQPSPDSPQARGQHQNQGEVLKLSQGRQGQTSASDLSAQSSQVPTPSVPQTANLVNSIPQVNQEVKVSQPKQVNTNELGPLRPVVRKSGSGSGVQSQSEEAWVNVLRPEKRRVIDCKELGDECRFYEDLEELREWRSRSGDHIFEPPEPELKGVISPQTHERLHKQLYELIINGKQQEALKLWEEFFNDTLLPKLVKLGEDASK